MKISLFIFSLLGLNNLLFAGDEAFEAALEKANKGDVKSAIVDLRKISSEKPGDARVHQSLGLLYQSNEQPDEAIRELERANSLSATPEALYSLGLLYESKWLSTKDNSWKTKAQNAWRQFVGMTPSSHPRRSIAEKHLAKLNRE